MKKNWENLNNVNIENFLSNLNTNKTCETNQISSFVLKKCAKEIAKPFGQNLEFAVIACFYLVMDIETLEKVQRRVSKIPKELYESDNEERIKAWVIP